MGPSLPSDRRNDVAPGTFTRTHAYTSAPTQRLAAVKAATPPTPAKATKRRTHPLLRGLVIALLALCAFAAVGEAAINLTPLGGRGGGFSYHAGYSIQNGWLCYGWSNGAYHCTEHWGYQSGVATSYNTAWVPNYGHQPTSGGTSSASSGGVSPAPYGISQWAYTGSAAWTMRDYAAWSGNKGALTYPFGQCTWMAAYLAHDNVTWLGNAKDWYWNARARGLPTGFTPEVGATVVFQPYNQGAGSLGHVAHVIAVYPNGWFKVEEMNFAWNGGGWGRVSYRYAHSGAGVSFVY